MLCDDLEERFAVARDFGGAQAVHIAQPLDGLRPQLRYIGKRQPVHLPRRPILSSMPR